MSIASTRRYVAAEMEGADTSGALFDYLRKTLKLKTQKALADWLEIGQPAVSHITNGRKEVGPSLILRIHEKSGMPVRQIRDLLAGVCAESREYD